jgi:hydrogenase maturation protease
VKPRVLIAGIGNIFHGDDAFGVVVAQRLLSESVFPDVEVLDFGIRGIDLVFAFLDGYDLVVLVDAVSRGSEPGALYVIEPDLNKLDLDDAAIDGHSLDPWQVLRQAARMGATFGRVVVVGCQPLFTESDEGRIGLSTVVEAAVEPAIGRVRSLVAEFINYSGKPVQAEECAV